MLGNIVYFIVTLSILVAFHEWGHFWVARRCGVHVQRFSVGFGKPLYRWQDRLGTEYVIAGIPLGGYVKMLDTRNEDVAAADMAKTFNAKSAWQRAAIVAAGPMANFLLAAIIYALVFIIGVPGVVPRLGEIEAGSPAALAGMRSGEVIDSVDGVAVVSFEDVYNRLLRRIGDSGVITLTSRVLPESFGNDLENELAPLQSGEGGVSAMLVNLPQQRYQISIDRWLAGQDSPRLYESLGLTQWRPTIPAVVGAVIDDGPAARAGLLEGDRITSVDGVALRDFTAFADLVRPRPNERVTITVSRETNGEVATIDFELEIAAVEQGNEVIGQIGVAAVSTAYPEWMRVTQQSTVFKAITKGASETFEKIEFTVESMVKMVQGLISPKNLSGPITIAQVAGSTAENGLVSYLKFLAILSVSLGVINLLPIPMLDGGQLVFIAAESAMGKPVPMTVQLGMQQFGLLAIFSLMAFALYNDFSRLL